MSERIVYLMRGLPSCGKSHTARSLVGPDGVVLETDQYFYTCVGDDPAHYDYQSDLLDDARSWNLKRFRQALSQGVSPIVVDRGNGLNQESCEYILIAQEHSYAVELREPDSPWWIELRVLLKYKQYVAPELFDAWAEKLAESSKQTHRVPAETIRRWMQAWRSDLTVNDILATQSSRQ
ncbi:MAG: AAA family ATPase [Pirellulaceae bacterium]